MGAYAPLATRLFGAQRIDITSRLKFFESLVLSRLLYNVALWTLGTSMAAAAVKMLNHVYMLVLRRIVDDS
eukprot:2416894-Karenia_brevis.AAC.1